ncbi:MAG: SprT family zinc-dependent metalloprotease [Oscillospiraceae bacterium]
MIAYKLTRSRRKTIALYVCGGGVEVRAPLTVSKARIDEFVASKENWIAAQLEKQKALTEQRAAFCLDYGSLVCYRGKDYPIVARPGNRAGFDEAALCFFLPPNLPAERVKLAVIQIYKLLAKRFLTERVAHFQKIMGVTVANLKINSAKTRWGSMSANKNVNFSWRLILAPDEIIDLVVVHELAHIKQMNHSDKFWTQVEAILPDWRERQKRLKELSRMINAQNWEVK